MDVKVYKIEGVDEYVASDAGGWITGVFSSPEAANYWAKQDCKDLEMAWNQSNKTVLHLPKKGL